MRSGLRVVVRDALGDVPAAHHLDERRGLRAAAVDEGELRGDGGLAALDVRRGRLVEEAQAVDRVVELRDDLPEARRGQLREVVLELRERPGGERRLLRVRHDVDGRVALEEGVQAPGVLVADDLERLHAARLEELGHADDVRLEEFGREDVGVDALEDVAHAAPRLHLERVVDVAGAVARDVGLVRDAHRRERGVELLLRVRAVGHGSGRLRPWGRAWRGIRRRRRAS